MDRLQVELIARIFVVVVVVVFNSGFLLLSRSGLVFTSGQSANLCKVGVFFEPSGQEGKYVFKKALEPYLSNEILYRSKMGFSVPVSSWLVGRSAWS